jgi:hypothetical protein
VTPAGRQLIEDRPRDLGRARTIGGSAPFAHDALDAIRDRLLEDRDAALVDPRTAARGRGDPQLLGRRRAQRVFKLDLGELTARACAIVGRSGIDGKGRGAHMLLIGRPSGRLENSRRNTPRCGSPTRRERPRVRVCLEFSFSA